MEKASAAVLGGFRLRSDAKIVRFPERYMDPRGEEDVGDGDGTFAACGGGSWRDTSVFVRCPVVVHPLSHGMPPVTYYYISIL